MKAKEFIIVESKKNTGAEAKVKARNPIAKNLGVTASGAGAHKDKKRDAKMGVEKHKKSIPAMAEGQEEKNILTRIRQIQYDRKLSGTDSNAGELHRLKEKLKELRNKQGVAEDAGEDLEESERNEMDTPEFQRALASLKKSAAQGPKKTVYDPKTGKYKVVPVNIQGKKND